MHHLSKMEGLTMEYIQQLQQRQRMQLQQPQQQQQQHLEQHQQSHMQQLQMQQLQMQQLQMQQLQRQRAREVQRQRAAVDEQEVYQQRERHRNNEREYREYNQSSGSSYSRGAKVVSGAMSGISSVLTIIPKNIWKWCKKFVRPDEIVTFDIPFKISTKFSPALFIIMMCMSFCNQFFRNIEIECTMSSDMVAVKENSHHAALEAELNNYCWNTETFLVSKALTQSMRGMVAYPGVSAYNRESDKLVRQKYYKYLWFGLAIIGIISVSPYFIWKFKGMTTRLKSLTDVGQWPSEEKETAVRVSYFIETIGFHSKLAYFYLFCKFLALSTPIANWIYLTGFIGPAYRLYGTDVLVHVIRDSWPNPMDVVFPKVAKCEWSKYGFTGEIELKSAQCILPMNNLTEWSFLFLWWWLIGVFLANLGSMLYFLVMWCQPSRNYVYRRYVAKVVHDEVEKCRPYQMISFRGGVKEVKTLTRNLDEILKVDLSLGDWLILYFIEKSLVDYQFHEFIRKLVVTKNPVLQLVQTQESNGNTI